MTTIFISYRRDETAGYAIGLREHLAKHYGAENVFMDIVGIEHGDDFVEIINEKVGTCDVFLALIGRSWADCRDPAGQRRLDKPDDFVRLEVAAALKRDARVIPVLLGGAKMPLPEQVPDDLRPLCRRNAIEISDTRFHEDIDRLIKSIDKNLSESAAKLAPRVIRPIQVLGLILAVGGGGLILHLNPTKITSIVAVGLIGLALVAISLAIRANALKSVDRPLRGWLVLGVLAASTCAVGAVVYVTATAVSAVPPDGARFDSKLTTTNAVVIKKPDQSYRVELRWQLFPLSAKEDQGATVFLGLVTLHDEEMTDGAGMASTTEDACADIPTCVGSHVLQELTDNPVFVRSGSGSPGSGLTAVVDMKRVPRKLRVWWEFYQREGLDGATCDVDPSRPGPPEGVPLIAMYDKDHKRIGTKCYRSFDQAWIPTSVE